MIFCKDLWVIVLVFKFFFKDKFLNNIIMNVMFVIGIKNSFRLLVLLWKYISKLNINVVFFLVFWNWMENVLLF